MTRKTFEMTLLEKAMKHNEGEIVINYRYFETSQTFMVVSAIPMTSIVWKRYYHVNSDLSIEFQNCAIAEFHFED